MSEENRGMGKGLLIGLLAGGAIGAFLALLYAPKSGKELRAQLKTQGGDLLDEAEEQLAKAKTKAVDIINEGKKKSDQLITEAKRRAESLLDDAEKIMSDAKEKAGTVAEQSAKLKTAVKAGVEAFKEERSRS
jgi:gas vesicle protein